VCILPCAIIFGMLIQEGKLLKFSANLKHNLFWDIILFNVSWWIGLPG